MSFAVNRIWVDPTQQPGHLRHCRRRKSQETPSYEEFSFLQCGPDGLVQMSAESLERGRTAVREPPMRGARKPQDDHRGLANAPIVRFRQSEEGRPPQSFAPSSLLGSRAGTPMLEGSGRGLRPLPSSHLSPMGPSPSRRAKRARARSGAAAKPVADSAFPTPPFLRVRGPLESGQRCASPWNHVPKHLSTRLGR